tara:strand:- start:1167 stop:2021 length:855 start_codon:yes stop_codon:yes gene_type:complete
MKTRTNDEKNDRRVIVTGATGFVGRHLVPLLLGKGYTVIAVARDSNKAKKFDWFSKVQFVELDLYKAQLNVPNCSDFKLIHLAWGGLPNYKENFHFEVNLKKDYEFIKELVSQGVTQVLVTGTCAEYGMQNGPLASTTQTCPNTSYALAKDCLRKFLELLSNESSFTLQWARLFYMYGEGQNPRSVLPQLDSAIDNGRSEFDMSGGEQIRDYLSVEDVAKSILQLFESGTKGTFNICSGKPITVRRLVDDRIKQREAKIKLNLGYYPYPDYEPLAFWGIPDIKV